MDAINRFNHGDKDGKNEADGLDSLNLDLDIIEDGEEVEGLDDDDSLFANPEEE